MDNKKEKEQIRNIPVRIPDDLNKKFKVILIHYEKTAQKIFLNLVKDIVKKDELIIKKYLK